MWMVFGFGALGFLIGNLVGLSSTPIVKSVVGLLFAFGGGSIIAFIKGIDAHDRKIAGASILALSLACTFGVYSGILVKTYHLLSPRSTTITGNTPAEACNATDPDYVKKGTASRAADINDSHNKDPEGAYQRLYQLALEYEDYIRKGGCK
jgi:hypothetical protein